MPRAADSLPQVAGAGAASRWLRIVGFPLLLLGVQGGLNGFFYETNDDVIMELLLQGSTGAGPVDDLHLYLHGWSHLLVRLYALAPAIPWYGLMLYLSLYTALAVSFWTLETINRSRLSSWQLAGVEIGFYALTYFLHAVQINFTRPALLLGAAAGLVLLVPRPTGRQPGGAGWLLVAVLLLAGWGIRPSGGALGLALTLPLALWQGWRGGLAKVGFLGLILLVVTVVRTATETAEVKAYRQNDLERSHLFDYGSSHLEVHTPLDSLAYATLVPYQGINDSVLLNPDFFRRTMRPTGGNHFNLNAYRAGLTLSVGSLVLRMPGCLLLVLLGLVAVLAAVRQRQVRLVSWPVLAYVAYQGFFWAVFVVLAAHMPLRVLQPIVTVYTLVNLVLVFGCLQLTAPAFGFVRRQQHLWLGLAGLLAVAWVAVNGRLLRQLRQDSAAHNTYLAQLAREVGPNLLVEQGIYAAYVHLSPLRDHHLQKYQKIVMLTGWPAFDPSQPRLRQALTGSRDLATALLRLGQRPGTRWLLQPAFADLLGCYLNERLALPASQRVRFEAVPGSQLPHPVSRPPRRYRLVREAARKNVGRSPVVSLPTPLTLSQVAP